MKMIDLKEKYKDELTAMKADAEFNLTEAADNLANRRRHLDACASKLANLSEVATTSKRNFFSVIAQLLKLAFSRNPSPEKVSDVIEPCNTYTSASKKIPKAKEDLVDARNCYESAQGIVAEAEDEFNKISSFFE